MADVSSSLPITNVAVLGATGSIGTAAIDVLRHLNTVDTERRWNLFSASGHQNLSALVSSLESLDHAPREIVLSAPETAASFDRARFGNARVSVGPEALVQAASSPEVDIVVASIVGRAGLESTLAAIDCGKRVALANKETLVVAGSLVYENLARSGAELLPVDSEHSAIFQCIGEKKTQAFCRPRKLILTASGGPFRTASKAEMDAATPELAMRHPTWEMGPKITIDSATMMNKALEIIEARWLFDMPSDAIEVVVHPQSIIHSMVEFEDGSVIAQLSPPDMRLPIQYALTYPRRLASHSPPLDCRKLYNLTIEPADGERFPALELGFEVARVGGTAGSVINAANEVAVGLFLEGKIRFTDIVWICRKVLESHNHESHPTLTELLRLDRWARNETMNFVQS